MRLANEMFDHCLGRVEIGDYAAAQRTYRTNITWRAADHLARLLAHRQHAPLAALLDDGHHRRFVQDDLSPAHIDQRVGRAEVDRDVFGESAEQTRKHYRTELRKVVVAPVRAGATCDAREAKLYARLAGARQPL